MPGGKATPRDLTPILQKFRDRMLGRKYINSVRFKEYDMVPKTMPPPNLPDGPFQRLSDMEYFKRDARRFVEPGKILAETPGAADRKLLASGDLHVAQNTQVTKYVQSLPKITTPGELYNPKLIDLRKEQQNE